jgi:hypothetical protein
MIVCKEVIDGVVAKDLSMFVVKAGQDIYHFIGVFLSKVGCSDTSLRGPMEVGW